MAYVEFMNNPVGRKVGDCTVRAISKALNMGWEAAYIALVINGLQMGDMPSSDAVSSALLHYYGFERMNIPNECPICYSVEDFCEHHRHGIYVLYCGGHVLTSIDGDWFDSWDSSHETVQYAMYKRKE